MNVVRFDVPVVFTVYLKESLNNRVDAYDAACAVDNLLERIRAGDIAADLGILVSSRGSVERIRQVEFKKKTRRKK